MEEREAHAGLLSLLVAEEINQWLVGRVLDVGLVPVVVAPFPQGAFR